MSDPRLHFFECTPETFSQWCAERGWEGYRAKQVFEWVYTKQVADPAAMTNLSARHRKELAQNVAFHSSRLIEHQQASDGTQKLLLQWEDAEGDAGSLPVLDASRQTECVMIPTESRKTACISSQVGCPVGCRFCASGLGGLDANLTTGRIVEQVWRLGTLPGVQRISNVVFMGMGEPLANFSPVLEAVRRITAQWGLGIGARKVTISTVGMAKAIRRLAEQLDVPVTLALSLHAPNDELRRELIPWAEYATIQELLEACSAWFEKTGREVTLEYILLGGVNDQRRHASELAEVATALRGNINLIRYNEVEGLPYARPRDADVRVFQDTLKKAGLNVHIRASRGRDIAAACGQLRHESAQ